MAQAAPRGVTPQTAHLVVGDLVVVLHEVKLRLEGGVARRLEARLARRHQRLDLVLRALRHTALLQDAAQLVEDRVQDVRGVLLEARAHSLHTHRQPADKQAQLH